ncbi:MAG: oligosaccharide flippase family protein [Hyphomicrobium sp.]
MTIAAEIGTVPPPPLARRVAGQGLMLVSGFALAQMLSFLRNALIGHGLSPGNFGIAATLTLSLQLIETLTDLGADRLIVQARDGDSDTLLANAHLALVARGLLTALALYLAAPSIAAFFAIPEATTAFQLMALAPLIRGFQHLDSRRAQRRFDNRPNVLIDVAPQVAALLATLPLLHVTGGFGAVTWLAVLQAGTALVVSHLVATSPYAMAADAAPLRRLITFGWPILLSALPLAAVYHGDRIIVGRFAGMEALAGYSAAFMLTMVPGLLAAKVGHALLLPLFSAAQSDDAMLRSRYRAASAAVCFTAMIYLTSFLMLGDRVLPLAFGPAYHGLAALVGCLALMWAIRMIQAVPGMALMAAGHTRPLLVAGLIRASALLPSLAAAILGFGLLGIAACGIAGELASLIYVSWRLSRERSGLGRATLRNAAMLIPAGLLALAAYAALPEQPSPTFTLLATMAVLGVVQCLAYVAMPGLKGMLHSLVATLPTPNSPTATPAPDRRAEIASTAR